jgi:hypothetical protein
VLSLPLPVRIFLCTQPADMRRSFDGTPVFGLAFLFCLVARPLAIEGGQRAGGGVCGDLHLTGRLSACLAKKKSPRISSRFSH